jgi:hypothetical protein
MQLEAMQQAGAEPYQRAESRKLIETVQGPIPQDRVGEIQLKKPQFREISFENQSIRQIFARGESFDKCGDRVVSPRSLNEAG